MDAYEMIERFKKKDRQALGKLITMVENNSPHMLDIMSVIYPMTGNAHVVGVTDHPEPARAHWWIS